MKNAVNIVLLTVGACLFYTYVSHMVPQKEIHPPETIEISGNMSAEEMVAIGEQIVGGKGTCLSCHTVGADKPGRFPDLGGVGARAGSRIEGYSDVEYLAESLYEPDSYLVEGFNPGMFAANKPPISLTGDEILAVIAYLQSLGGEPTVTTDTQLKYVGTATESAPAAVSSPTSERDSTGGVAQTGDQLLLSFLCTTCHSLDTPDRLVGPSLFDVGQRLTKPQLYEAIKDPDATIAEGFPPAVMVATLTAQQFYDKISAVQLKTLVGYLAEKKGNE